MIRQTAHIIIPPREKRSVTFRIFTAETTPQEEADRGLLFGCFTIDYYHHRNEEIIDSIIEELQSRYYDPDITTQEPEKLLEETLQALNTTLAQLIEHEQIFLNLKRFHAIIGVLKGKSLTFTHVGDMRVHLLHQAAGQKQQCIDLLATTENSEQRATPPVTRIFSALISGSIRTNDVVLFATNSLFDYTTKENVQKILGSLPPPRAVEQIKALVKGEQRGIGVLCFIIRLAPEHEALTKTSARDSITALQTTEKDTRGYLAPSVVRSGMRYVRTAAHLGEKIARTILRLPPNAERKEIVSRVLQMILAVIRICGRFVIMLQRTAIAVARMLVTAMREEGGWRRAFAEIKQQSEKGQKVLGKFTVRQQALMITAGALALLLLVSTATIGIQRSRAAKKQAYEKSIALITERIATAEASLLFKDEERTKTIYNEAKQLIETLPRRTKDERTAYETLTKEIELHLEKLRHVVQLDRLDLVKDFSELDPAVDLTTFVTRDTNAYVAHAARPLLYKVNLENKQVFTLDASEVDVRPIQHMAQEGKGALYLAFDASGLASLNLDRQSVSQTDITFGETGTRVDAINLYNKRLYLLDTTNDQIWRHDQKDGVFAKGTTWLKAAIDLDGVRSFAIDGAVWLVKENEVVRLLQGKVTNWKLGSVDPQGMSLQSIIVSQQGNRLWLLDKAGKRVLAVTKDSGNILAQYPLPAEDIRDFEINEKTGEILLLTKTKLLKLTYEKE